VLRKWHIITISVITVSFVTILSIEAQQDYNIPSWIKNAAGWWATDQIEESEFLKLIEFLIDEKIIKIDYDPIYENEYNSKTISKIQLFESIPDAIENSFANDHQFRIDVDGTLEGYEVNQIKIYVIQPNDEILDISPTTISFHGYYSTSGIKINSNSLSGLYEIRTEVDKQLLKQQYFFIKDNSTSKVPNWIKNNAKWWAEGRINDDDFLFGVKFLVKEKIIKFERVLSKPVLADARKAIFSGDDLKPTLYSITGDQLEAFLDLKKGNKVVLSPIKTDNMFTPVYFEIKAPEDAKYPLKLPFGTYKIKVNNYEETFDVGSFGHNSTILKTTDNNTVYCLGTFLSFDECMGHKKAKFEDYGIKFSHEPEWYQTKFQKSFDYDDYFNSYSDHDFVIDYGTDVDYLLKRGEHYANLWIGEIEPYAQAYIEGKISWNEYESKGFSSFDNYADQYISDFDNYFDSKYGYYP